MQCERYLPPADLLLRSPSRIPLRLLPWSTVWKGSFSSCVLVTLDSTQVYIRVTNGAAAGLLKFLNSKFINGPFSLKQFISKHVLINRLLLLNMQRPQICTGKDHWLIGCFGQAVHQPFIVCKSWKKCPETPSVCFVAVTWHAASPAHFFVLFFFLAQEVYGLSLCNFESEAEELEGFPGKDASGLLGLCPVGLINAGG